MVAPPDFYDDKLASESILEPLFAYLNAFDGTKKEFKDIQHLFDNLFSDDLFHLMDGHPTDRNALIRLNEYMLQQRIVAVLEDIYFQDDTHVEYTVHWGNEDVSMVRHVVALVDDGKIIKLEPCEETKSVFANFFHDVVLAERIKVYDAQSDKENWDKLDSDAVANEDEHSWRAMGKAIVRGLVRPTTQNQALGN